MNINPMTLFLERFKPKVGKLFNLDLSDVIFVDDVQFSENSMGLSLKELSLNYFIFSTGNEYYAELKKEYKLGEIAVNALLHVSFDRLCYHEAEKLYKTGILSHFVDMKDFNKRGISFYFPFIEPKIEISLVRGFKGYYSGKIMSQHNHFFKGDKLGMAGYLFFEKLDDSGVLPKNVFSNLPISYEEIQLPELYLKRVF